MIHQGKRRNSNECFSAYGHEFTWEEMLWLTNWCFVRGVNMLSPHAFYYSVWGHRKDERPPDVGPNSPWWGDYKRYADYCRRLSWVNTDSRHVCPIAIVCASDELPWRAARVCFENQRDFNYLELRHILSRQDRQIIRHSMVCNRRHWKRGKGGVTEIFLIYQVVEPTSRI